MLILMRFTETFALLFWELQMGLVDNSVGKVKVEYPFFGFQFADKV